MVLRRAPTFVQLTALFAGAVTAAGWATGCGPCRAAYAEYEKLVPLDDDMAPDADTLLERCDALCRATSSDGLESCEDINVEGTDMLSCVYSHYADCGGIGRLPAGMCIVAEGDEGAALGRYFARVTHLEAASVYAFRQLARELAAHGAPADLIRRADDAARDEARHTRLMFALARRFGGNPIPPEVRNCGVRSLSAIAQENAVEGCVRETFGAAVAAWQAQHAASPEVRRVMQVISADETRHAELAFLVHAWAISQLDPAAAERIEERARAAAATHLANEREPDAHVAHVAGFPDAATQRTLAQHIGDRLWRAAA